MNENPKIISESKYSYGHIILIVLGIFFFGFLIYIFNTQTPIKVKYENHIRIGFNILYGGFIVYCLYYLFNLKKIIAYKDYFIIKKLFKSEKYYFNDFISYWDEYFEGKYNSWTEYHFILKDDKQFKLIDNEYSNFHSIINNITKNIKKNKDINQKLNKPRYLKYSIISGILSCLFFYISSNFYDFEKINNNDLTFISGTLKDNIKEFKGRRGIKHLEFKLSNYPIFEFNISEFIMKSSKNDLTVVFKPNEFISVGISKEDYNKKIDKKDSLNFKDKYLNYTTIFVQQIGKVNGENYIKLDNYNKLNNQNNYFGIGLFSFFGLFFLFLTIGNYRAYINPNKEFELD
jgi:hypothetical protein